MDLGSDRSPAPLRQTHSSRGSGRASPGPRRCSASPPRTSSSSWCRRRTAVQTGAGGQSRVQHINLCLSHTDVRLTILTKAEMKTRMMENTPTRVLLVRDWTIFFETVCIAPGKSCENKTIMSGVEPKHKKTHNQRFVVSRGALLP